MVVDKMWCSCQLLAVIAAMLTNKYLSPQILLAQGEHWLSSEIPSVKYVPCCDAAV